MVKIFHAILQGADKISNSKLFKTVVFKIFFTKTMTASVPAYCAQLEL